ncbi:Uncharacterised protein [Vibrio cholerae]|nr:Uncharacterised protein [Vibrio cholerae]
MPSLPCWKKNLVHHRMSLILMGVMTLDNMRVMTAITIVTVKPQKQHRLQWGMLLKRGIQITLIKLTICDKP